MINSLKPIVVGITGHRQLRNQDILQLEKVVRQQLEAVILKCPDSPVKILTSLAEGADQLCAEIAQELNIGILAALPMEIEEYKKDFSEGTLLKFERLISNAEEVFVAPPTEEKDENINRDYYYRQADIYIANHSHCLIALWDGSPAVAKGCGTAETVDMALNHSYESYRCVHNHDGFVIHIMTPRNPEGDNAGVVTCLGNNELFEESIAKLNELNKEGGDPDILSVKSGKKYRKALMLLSVLGTVLTLSFLLYDNAMIIWMLFVLGFVLAMMVLISKLANKSKSHQKYIEYRGFAECIRIQKHLNHCGIDLDVTDCLAWNERFNDPWIVKAIQTFNIGRKIDKTEEIRKDWILEQQKYHEAAAEKTRQQLDRNNAIVKFSLYASIGIYILALLFEYVISKQLESNVEIIRTVIKLAVGTASAASFFAANYYGKLSLKRVYEDHLSMASYFKNAADYLDDHDVSGQFIYELIAEELSENSNWCSYEKDNEININI